MIALDLSYMLQNVQKASRYIGGEYNSIVKEGDDYIKFALCFPDVYEVAASHLGIKILYHQLSKREDTKVERVFAPWVDMEEELRKHNALLFSLETKTPLKDFDIAGFTLQYELSYTNILNMLDLSGIPILSKERTDGPFVCAGGPCAFNPEPLADFIDFFVIGEGEEVTEEILDVYKKWKNEKAERIEFLKEISKIQGVYVPLFYEPVYNEDGEIREFKVKEDVPKTVKKRYIKDIDSVFYPEEFIVPFCEIVHDRIMLELQRGCIRGCRFCQAGMIYRPVRERSPEKLTSLAKKLIESTGYEEISMTSLSSSDYSRLEELTDSLLEITGTKRVNLALPSLRVDSISLGIMEKVQKVRKTSFTFAPEAGSQRLRDVINKGITEDDILNGLGAAFEGGASSVKLYFMIGLPGETMEDILEIGALVKKIQDKYYSVDKSKRGRGLSINVSVSTFVPKPFTPFQWEGQISIAEMREKQLMLRDLLRSKTVSYNWHESKTSVLEAAFSRGDRNIGKVLLNAFKLGCRFDGWDEHFSFEKWMQAFEEAGIDYRFYAERKRSFEEILPWDIIDSGIGKKFLIKECEKAYAGDVTENCREKCAGCGIGCYSVPTLH